MKNLVDLNKNASVLAMLLCCLFLNPGVGKAQMGKWQTSFEGGTVTITPEKNCSGVC